MNRSQSSPLGLSARTTEQVRQSAGRSTNLDRWLVGQLSGRFDASRVRFELWDQPKGTRGQDSPVTLRFRERRSFVEDGIVQQILAAREILRPWIQSIRIP